ncbi:hypothetical protein QQ045_023386 [Rhodiola kirilowii]
MIRGLKISIPIFLISEGSDEYIKELDILAYKPQFHACYTHCVVNGLKFIVFEKDQHLKTQNSGVMVKAGEINYYGILTNIIELTYAEGMPVVIFKCKWYNTDPEESGNIKMNLGIFSIDTSNTWFENAPYCLAKHAHQVFYLEDPKFGDNWRVVNLVTQRGTYSDSCLSYNDKSNVLEEAYQEECTTNIPPYMCNALDEEDDEMDVGLESPLFDPLFYDAYDSENDADAVENEEDTSEYEDDDEEDDGLHYVSDNELSEHNEDEEDDDDDEYDEE